MKSLYSLFAMLALMLAFSLPAAAQSAWAITHSHKTEYETVDVTYVDGPGSQAIVTERAAVISFKNLWLGTTAIWSVDRDNPIESPSINGKILYSLYNSDHFSFPLVGNLSLRDNGDIETPDEGLTIGAYPWLQVSSGDKFNVILHAGVGYRRFTDPDSIDQTELKLLGGVEAAFITIGDRPATLNISPVFTMGQNNLPNRTALEVTGIFPIAEGFGAMAQVDFPFGDNAEKSLFRLGVLAVAR